MKGDRTDSLLALKQKFDEIKQSINLIETKQASSFTRTLQSAGRLEQAQTRSSVTGRGKHQACQDNVAAYYKAKAKALEREREEMLKTIKELRCNCEEAAQNNLNLETDLRAAQAQVAQLLKENAALKQQRRPSCLRNASSTPKHHRVAFSDDLEQVVHINETDCPSTIEKSRTRQVGRITHPMPKKCASPKTVRKTSGLIRTISSQLMRSRGAGSKSLNV